jgi:hypothetical protein
VASRGVVNHALLAVQAADRGEDEIRDRAGMTPFRPAVSDLDRVDHATTPRQRPVGSRYRFE